MATMQVKNSDGQWVDIGEFSCFGMASGTIEYRVKPMPEKKPDVVRYIVGTEQCGKEVIVCTTAASQKITNRIMWQIKVTRDGETGELINAEVLK